MISESVILVIRLAERMSSIVNLFSIDLLKIVTARSVSSTSMVSPLSIAMNLESSGSSMISESDIITILFADNRSSVVMLSDTDLSNT